MAPRWPTPELHGGTVTFLFTDIEGSTRLLKAQGAGYGQLLAEHRRILRAACAVHEGHEIDTQGDSFFFAFRRAKDALAAALDGQRGLAAHSWPDGAEPRVRMGLHSGEPVLEDGRYVGIGVHRAARIGGAAHGGQVLLSSSTRELVEDDLPAGVSLRELGLVRLKDIDRPERISQLAGDGLRAEFPPLRGAEPVLSPRSPRRRWLLAALPAGIVLAAAAVAIPLFVLGGAGGGKGLARIDANSVGAVDPSGRLVASIPVGTTPGSVAFGAGSIWVTNNDAHSVSRIDPKTNAVVQTIEVGSGPAGVAFGGGFVWVTNSLDGTVSKIDPNDNNGTVVATPLVGNGPSGIAYGVGSLWVANSSDRTLVRIAPRTATVTKTIPVGAGADAVAVGDGLVWVTSESGNSVTRINARSGTLLPPINVGNGPSAVALGAGAAWVANNLDGTVSRINPKDGTVAKVIPVGAGPTGIAVSADGVWVSNEVSRTLSRISPAHNNVVQTIRLGNRPAGVALTGNALYAAVRTSGLAHRGGTLTVLEHDRFDSVDPAIAYDFSTWPAMMLTNDGLTGYRRVGGSDGARLVPDLATSLPAPTDRGKTYTFQLRPGIHYSTGALVRPADFRRGLERTLAEQGPTAFYFSAIVSAARCMRNPRRCDLSRGIVADAESNTVTFRLSAPDPDFLHKLTLPAAFAVPASTPLRAARLPLPATGPYMIASYDKKRDIRLVRNPRFREWSRAAQPSGYPDKVVLRTGLTRAARVRAVERGTADVMQGAPASALGAQYASQLQTNPLNSTLYLFLNTRLPPFDNLKVRQAVNYAVDRNRVVELLGGSDVPSCQVLPPNSDGYRRYCPYTTDPRADGRYIGPELAKAQQLVTASGTRGQAVTVWAPTPAPFPLYKADPYLVSTLQSLGYRARLKLVPVKKFFSAVLDTRSKVQAALDGWITDYLSASAFVYPLLTCASHDPHSPNSHNEAAFCNPSIDREIARARSRQTTDPHAASQLWSRVDHDIVDQAPWVALLNPRWTDFVSRRVGNYQYNPQWRALLDQMWVR